MKIHDDLKDKINLLRRKLYLLETDKYQHVLCLISESKEASDELDKHINTSSFFDLKKFLQARLRKCLEEMSFRDLIEIAKNLRVANYSRMTKQELAASIKYLCGEKQ
jgi:hypothetical protein